MTRTVRRLLQAAVLGWAAIGAMATGPSALAQQRVGVNSAVNPDAMGIPSRRVPAPVGARSGRGV